MPDEHTIADEVRDFVLENLRTYMTRGDGAIEKLLADFAPDLSFIPAVEANSSSVRSLSRPRCYGQR